MVFVWLAELAAPHRLDLVSSANAAGKGKGKGKGQGNAGGNGNGNGNANPPGNSKDGGDDGGGSGDFHDEGFGPPGLSLGGKDGLPPGRALDRLKGGDHTSKDHLRDDVELGETFDLPQIDGAIGPEADELSEFLDIDTITKVNAASEDRPGNGPPEGRPGNGPPENNPGNGSPDNKPGNGPPEHAQAHGLKKDRTQHPPGLAAKGEDVESAAQAAETGTDAPGIDIASIAPGSYATYEVLALELGSAGLTRVRQLGFAVDDSILSHATGGVIRLITPARMDATDALALLRRELPGEQFHLNRVYHSYLPAEKETRAGAGRKCPDDKCYGKGVIRWKETLSKCARSLRIGVIDTGADLLHPAFAGRKITQASFIPSDRQPAPNWHGTGVLALLAGAPDSSTPGLIPDANFFLASIFFTNEAGSAVTDTISMLRAFEWMTKSGVQLVNMSFAGPRDALVLERIRAMRTRGMVLVAAAGNEGPAARPTYPAAYPDVLAVTAVTKDLRVFAFAGRGPHIDISAPGVEIWTAIPNGQAGFRTGTSFAAPFATAVLALESPDLFTAPEAELLDKLRTVNLGPNGRDPIFGRGLLQAPTDCAAPSETLSSWTPALVSPK